MALTAKKVYAILKRQISDMEAKLNSPVRYRGTVATADLLPLNPDIGDMYNIESKSVYGEAGMNVAWNGVVWDTMGAPIDMSLYLTKEEAEAVIQRLVTEYFEKNPVKPGATTEQAQQIEQNKTDIASLKVETGSLKEDISNKITKFYASSQGETHLADSDNGKIMDMMLYGKSEQKQYSGKNLFDVNDTGGPFPLSADSNGWYIVELSNAGSNIVYKNITTKPSNKLKPSTLYTIIAEIEYLEEALVCVSSTYPSDVTEFKGQINADIEIKKTGISKATATTVDDFSNSDTLLRTFVRIDPGKTAKAKFRISIVEGDATENPNWEYEPYTGGIPSPNPDYPQEIKSVVNPIVKVCGKNLLKATLRTTTQNGVTCTANGDGTYTLNGTASANAIFNLGSVTFTGDTKYKICGCPQGGGTGERYHIESHGSTNEQRDIGNGVIYSLPNDETKVIYIVVTIGFRVNNLLFKPMITTDLAATYDDFEPYHEQTVTLPYTLNAIPVSSGGNITIDGQQYVSDYVNVERGKLVRMVANNRLLSSYNWNTANEYYWGSVSAATNGKTPITADNSKKMCACKYLFASSTYDVRAKKSGIAINNIKQVVIGLNYFASVDDLKTFLANNDVRLVYPLEVPTEIDLTPEEIAAFKALATYYPTTNISANSEQLDGYTVFNYPISMKNGWDYVKQQIGDTRDYIYDMDARTQDTDLQSAEAYVNSEYAVALTELEV